MTEAVARSLQWSVPQSANARCHYDHVFAESPLGEFSIEWKSWKTADYRDLYLAGDHLGSFRTVEEAQIAATNHLRKMAQRLAGY